MTASPNTSLVGFCRIPIVKEHQRTMIAGNIETNHHVVCKIISFGIIWIPQFWKIIMYLRCFNHHVLHIHIVTKPPFAPHRWSSNCRHRPGGKIPGKNPWEMLHSWIPKWTVFRTISKPILLGSISEKKLGTSYPIPIFLGSGLDVFWRKSHL